MKRLMLLTTLCVWLNAGAQQIAGVQQYYTVHNHVIDASPLLWYQGKTNWYAEGRYNAEAPNSVSVYGGKTIEKKSAVSYVITPLLGAVVGEYNGGSVGVDAELEHSDIVFSLQSQYTFSVQDHDKDFLYAWSDLGYNVTQTFAAGVSMQQTYTGDAKLETEKGIYAKASFGNWAFPLYVYNPENKERSFMLGIHFTWQNKKSHKDYGSIIEKPDHKK